MSLSNVDKEIQFTTWHFVNIILMAFGTLGQPYFSFQNYDLD